MFKIFIQTVFSLTLIGALYAKDFPLQKRVEVEISNHSTTVLEFPFKIQDIRFDKFKRITYVSKNELQQDKEDLTEGVTVPSLEKVTETKVVNGKKITVVKSGPTSTPNKNTQEKPLRIKKSKDGNIVELEASMTGSTKAIVWGYEHYPIMLEIKIVKASKEANDYFKFIDYSIPTKEVKEFEAASHETVIQKLLLDGYLEQTPKGYEKTVLNGVEKTNDYILQLNTVLTGKEYMLKEYSFMNTSDKDFKIDEKMFYQKGSVYAVSVEKLGRVLQPNEKTRVFVVLKKG